MEILSNGEIYEPPKVKQDAYNPMEVPEDNPISQMMALKHPEMQKDIDDA